MTLYIWPRLDLDPASVADSLSIRPLGIFAMWPNLLVEWEWSYETLLKGYRFCKFCNILEIFRYLLDKDFVFCMFLVNVAMFAISACLPPAIPCTTVIRMHHFIVDIFSLLKKNCFICLYLYLFIFIFIYCLSVFMTKFVFTSFYDSGSFITLFALLYLMLQCPFFGHENELMP